MKTKLSLAALMISVLHTSAGFADCAQSLQAETEIRFQQNYINTARANLAAFQQQINDKQGSLDSIKSNREAAEKLLNSKVIFIGKMQTLANGLDTFSARLLDNDSDRAEIARQIAEIKPEQIKSIVASWNISERIKVELIDLGTSYTDLAANHPKEANQNLASFAAALSSNSASKLQESLATTRDSLIKLQEDTTAEIPKINLAIAGFQQQAAQVLNEIPPVQQFCRTLENEIAVRTKIQTDWAPRLRCEPPTQGPFSDPGAF